MRGRLRSTRASSQSVVETHPEALSTSSLFTALCIGTEQGATDKTDRRLAGLSVAFGTLLTQVGVKDVWESKT